MFSNRVRTTLTLFLLLAGIFAFSPSGKASFEPSQIAFRSAKTTEFNANLVNNPGLEIQNTAGTGFTNWWWSTAIDCGNRLALGVGISGSNAIKLTRSNTTTDCRASQIIQVNQTSVKPFMIRGWSRAINVSSDIDNQYSIFADITYQDNSMLYAQSINFDNGTHDWQQLEKLVMTTKPVAKITLYLMFRGDHTGSALFDNIEVLEAKDGVGSLDQLAMVKEAASANTRSAAATINTTSGNLGLTLNTLGGVHSLKIFGKEMAYQSNNQSGGFLIKDFGDNGDWVSPGGTVINQSASEVTQTAVLDASKLAFSSKLTASAADIEVNALLRNTSGTNKAISLYYSLPIDANSGWKWADNLRGMRQIEGSIEYVNLSDEYNLPNLGANGGIGKYPFGAICKENVCLAFMHSIEKNYLSRIAYNTATKQFYLVFDLAMTANGALASTSVDFKLTIFAFTEMGVGAGFRALLDGYYDRYPELFERRIAPSKEGLWTPGKISDVSKVEDFKIGFHQVSSGALDQSIFDFAHNIQTFRYISQPGIYVIQMPGVNVKDYNSMTDYLEVLSQGTGAVAQKAKTIKNVGMRDQNGWYLHQAFSAAEAPGWCGGNSCVYFYMNTAPGIGAPSLGTETYTPATAAGYQDFEGLSGEMLDSFMLSSGYVDFNEANFRAETGISFSRARPTRPVVPSIFAQASFVKWLKGQLPSGKYLMANFALSSLYYGANSLDFTGQEIDLISGGKFVPWHDKYAGYRRVMFGQKPYGLLLNTDLSVLQNSEVEKYIDFCLFYGFYPGIYTNGGYGASYFEQPSLYERDRSIFTKYLPEIKKISEAGWEPITRAESSDPTIYIERYGDKENKIYFTLRNTNNEPKTFNLKFDRKNLAASALDSLVLFSLIKKDPLVTSILSPETDTVELSLQAGETALIQINRRTDLSVTPEKKYTFSGDKLYFNVSYLNDSQSFQEDVDILVTLPVGLQLVSGSITGGGVYDVNNRKISWSVNRVEMGERFEAKYQVLVLN
jgi:hypothetical protein